MFGCGPYLILGVPGANVTALRIVVETGKSRELASFRRDLDKSGSYLRHSVSSCEFLVEIPNPFR